MSVSDYSTVGVVDTVGSSPLRALVMQRLGNDIPAGIRLRVDVSKAIPLLQWQKQRGFSNVREHVLRKLGVKLKVDDLPPATATHGSMEERLVTQIVLKENPHVSQEELRKPLCTRRALEDNLEDNTHIDQWLLDETMATKDRAEQMKRQKDITVNKLSVKQSAFETRKLLDSLKPFLKNKKSRTAKTCVQKTVERLRKSKGDHWYTIYLDPGDAVDRIQLLKPDDCAVVQDNQKGYFRIAHRRLRGEVKHVSWTKRGIQAAVAAVLGQMWRWEEMVTGTPCPLPEAMLAMDYFSRVSNCTPLGCVGVLVQTREGCVRCGRSLHRQNSSGGKKLRRPSMQILMSCLTLHMYIYIYML